MPFVNVLSPETRDDGFDDLELARRFVFLHAEKSTQFIEIELVRVFISHFLLDELVPVRIRKRSRTDHQFVPFT